MSIEQFLGYGQLVIDMAGLGNVIPTIVTISIAGLIIGLFIRMRRD